MTSELYNWLLRQEKNLDRWTFDEEDKIYKFSITLEELTMIKTGIKPASREQLAFNDDGS